MKVNVTQPIKELDGSQLMTGKDTCPTCRQTVGKTEQMTLRSVVVDALLTTFGDERELSGEDKLKRYDLAVQIYACDEMQLKAEEVALIKKLVARRYGPLVTGQAWAMLDPKE
jgi:hypothetical protein